MSDEPLIALARQAHRVAGEIRLLAERADTLGMPLDRYSPAEVRRFADTVHGLAFACAFQIGSTDLLNELTGRRWRRVDPPGGAG
jgi:hypothetical protein